MIALATPISESKCYCFYDYARGIWELDYPKDKLYIIFSVDTNGADKVNKKIDQFIEHWPYPDNCFVLATYLKGNNPMSRRIPWQKRAEFAATLRNQFFHFVCDNLPDVTHIFSVGSDMILEPHSLTNLLSHDRDLVSGLYCGRVTNNPLILWLNRQDNSYGYIDFDHESKETIECDWTGLDSVLISRKVFETVNWDDFDVNEHNLGEDAHFYDRAYTKLGIKPLIDLSVQPLHIHENGEIKSLRRPELFGMVCTCPNCGSRTRIGKLYYDLDMGCKCKTIFPMEQYWKPREIDMTAIGLGLPTGKVV